MYPLLKIQLTVPPGDCYQVMGQLPASRLTPGSVFQHTGIDFAGPLLTKYSYTRKPVTVKTYICVFVSFSVKAVHLEPVSDLTTDAFLACLRRFISRRGRPQHIHSDHGTNFVGASKETGELYKLLKQQYSQGQIIDFCTSQNIKWHFTPEKSPHFGGLWEAAVKSAKIQLKKVVGCQLLTFEELTTVLCQIEACLNSRPLVSTTTPDEDGIEYLSPGHFLIGQPIEALPDKSDTTSSISLLKRWNLCQQIIRSFWNRWSSEYLTQLQKYTKWHSCQQNIKVGDIVLLKDQQLFVNNWPLGRVITVHPGADGKVRVVTVQTASNVYKRPVHKIVLLLPANEDFKTSSSGAGMLAPPTGLLATH